jgi:hypothetical protein
MPAQTECSFTGWAWLDHPAEHWVPTLKPHSRAVSKRPSAWCCRLAILPHYPGAAAQALVAFNTTVFIAKIRDQQL